MLNLCDLYKKISYLKGGIYLRNIYGVSSRQCRKCRNLSKNVCEIETINKNITKLKNKMLGNKYFVCSRNSSEYAVTRQAFCNLLDLHDKNNDFANELYILYSIYAHLHTSKKYDLIFSLKNEIGKLFCESCSAVFWNNKNIISGFLHIAKMNCSADSIPRWSILYPAIMTLMFEIFSPTISSNLDFGNILAEFGNPIIDAFIYILRLLIIFIIITIITRKLYLNDFRKSIIEEANQYRIIDNFIELCEEYITNHL